MGKARIAYQKKDMAGAAILVDKALSIEPNDTEALILKG